METRTGDYYYKPGKLLRVLCKEEFGWRVQLVLAGAKNLLITEAVLTVQELARYTHYWLQPKDRFRTADGAAVLEACALGYSEERGAVLVQMQLVSHKGNPSTHKSRRWLTANLVASYEANTPHRRHEAKP